MMEQEIDLILGFRDDELINIEWLIALDEFIAKPSFEANNMYSNLLDIQREEDGFIYTLAPSFSGQAMYYNKELFDQYQVEYPRDYMGWEEIIYLDAQFPEQEVTGLLYYGPPSFLLEDMLNTNRVEIIDEQNRLNILQNDALKDVLYQFVSINPDHNFEEYNFFDNDRFENGNVAMVITEVGQVERYDIDFDWDLVSRPIPPDGSKETAYLYFLHNLSIFSGTYHLEEAWEIISFINGEETADIFLVDDWVSSIPVRHTKFIKETEKNYAHLYTLKPNNYTAIPDTFGNGFRSILHSVLKRILVKDISIEQGIIEINDQAQALLHEW